jgi:glycyl-tRNA synthetase beta chain
MVMEFPELQGVMGREYALLEGYPDDICQAILEHYLPTGAGGELPESDLGALVGLADRMDTITGCFAVGLEPTGDADPFALRRHALAIIHILEKKKWNVSLQDFISRSLDILSETIAFDRTAILEKVVEFFRERYKQLMLRAGYTSELVEAVLSVNFDLIPMIRPKIDQLKTFSREEEEFESLVLSNKRISNILKNQEDITGIDRNLFQHECEARLWETFLGLKDDIQEKIRSGQYTEALNLMMRLRKPVDDFFDSVEVLTKENPDLRKNRIGILRNLLRLFLSLADFSKLSI